MAITSLAERQSMDKVLTGGTNAYVGPGSYVQHSHYSFMPSCAPFMTTSTRMQETLALSEGPDPGSYDPLLPGTYSKMKDKFNYNNYSAPFGSSQARLKNSRGGTRNGGRDRHPGPGSYLIGGIFQNADVKEGSKTIGSVPKNQKQEFIERSKFNRPSIPIPEQAHGYDEGQGGILVKQDPPDKPPHYGDITRAKKVTGKRTCGGAFPTALRKGLSNIQDVPGPGNYSITQGNLSANTIGAGGFRGVRPSPAFKSGPSRGGPVVQSDNNEPGPGQYYNYETGVKSKKSFQRNDCQFFGSTDRRFKKLKVDASPGPAAYASSTGNISEWSDAGRRNPNASLNKKGRTFHLGADRFRDTSASMGDDVGPGQYDVASNTDGFFQKSFSILSNQGSFAFGGTARRFERSSNSKSDENEAILAEYADPARRKVEEVPSEPGPGAYEAPTAFKLEQGKVSAAFQKPLKKSDKFIRGEDVKPSPCAYSPRLINQCNKVVRVPPKNEGFLGSSQRFKGNKKLDDQAPGPGIYEIRTNLGGKKTNQCDNLSFGVTAERFQEKQQKTSAPGPAAYAQHRLWEKKSYNILFN